MRLRGLVARIQLDHPLPAGDGLVEVPGGEALVMRRALTSVTFSEENVRDGSGTIIQDAGEGGRALADYILSVVK